MRSASLESTPRRRASPLASSRSRTGREICAVYVSLRDVGLEQIRAGMAWHYKEYQHEQPTRSGSFTATRRKARRRGEYGRTRIQGVAQNRCAFAAAREVTECSLTAALSICPTAVWSPRKCCTLHSSDP